MKLLLLFSTSFIPFIIFAQQPIKPRVKDSTLVVKYDEVMPEFPGGQKALVKYIEKNLHYPKEARKMKIEGRVIVQFVIDENGNVRDAKVLTDIGGGCGEEALKIVNGMPKWSPGIQDGKAVKVYFKLPILFKR